jgi:hypothetical protein
MRPSLVLFIFGVTFLMASCMLNGGKNEKSAKNDYDTISINGQYSMHIPKFMTKAANLNNDASLQYQNIFKEVYVIVIDENKKEFIETYNNLGSYDSTRSPIANYADTQVQLITSNANVINKTEVTNFTINGANAATTEIDASIEGVKTPITYFLTFIDGKDNLYMIMAWTLRDKKETHRPLFDEIAKSFKMVSSE